MAQIRWAREPWPQGGCVQNFPRIKNFGRLKCSKKSSFLPNHVVVQRHPTDKGESASIDYLRLLFPACQVGRAPPWTACRATQPPHGDGRSSCRHLQTPGRLCQTKVIQKLEYHPKRASKEPSRQWVIGTQKERSDYSCAFTRLR